MKEQNTLEIDVLQLFRALWKRKLVILLVAIITSSVAFAYSTFVIKPEFTSTTRIYVVNRNQGEKSGLTNQDLQAGSYLVKDYREIILSQDVLEEVISDLKLDLTPKGLANKIKVTVPVDTRIVSVSVNDRVPEEASRIANSLREVAAQKIISITRVSDVATLEEARPAISPSSPNIKRNTLIGFLASRIANSLREVAAQKIISITRVSDVATLEEARPAISPSSPNIKRNTLIGFLAGGIGTSVIVLLLELLDTHVKRPEDIEDTLQMTLLGVVPNLGKLK
ncbi:capsular polysaccharide biosynthesis protein Cps14C [Streptococcus pneumoniae]|nr:capsular polysaccharide biosynthesis protein Cps14C [Streptococcus pneumoniae]